MKNTWTIIAALTLFVPSLAFAQDAPPDGLEALAPLIEAAQGGQWSLFASLLIMILVWLATKAPLIKDWIKGEAKIWVAAVAGMLAASATAMWVGHMAGAIDWLSVIAQGLSVGLAAGGLWSLIGRKIAGKSIDADGDGVLDDPALDVGSEETPETPEEPPADA
jgi:hypothetical protein